MKKTRLTAFLLAAAMMMLCAVPAFADSCAMKASCAAADDTGTEDNAQRSIENMTIYINGESDLSYWQVFEYTGREIMPETFIINGDGDRCYELSCGKDYSVEYFDNTNIGTARMKITGMGEYTGVVEYSFEIKSHDDIFPFKLDDGKETPDFYDMHKDNGVIIAKPWVGSFDTIDIYEYEFGCNDNGTVNFISADGGLWYVKVPAYLHTGYYYDHDIVVGVGIKALANNDTAKAVELPNTIVVIEEDAFRGMKAVKRIYVPVSVKKIAQGAFDDLPEDFKLICVKGSYAEEYASSHNIPYTYPENDDFDKETAQNAQRSIEDTEIYIDGTQVTSDWIPFDYEYTGGSVTPKIKIKDGSKTLTPDVDYFVRYTQNKSIGTAYIIIKGRESYRGYRVYTFEIKDHADIMPFDPVMGDLDDDGYCTSNDALLVLRAAADLCDLSEQKRQEADLDEDGEVTSADAVAVLRLSIGIY